MSHIEKVLRKIFVFFVTGKGIRGTAKFLWGKFWEEIDRTLGIIVRWAYKYRVKVIPNKVFFHTQENRYTCNPKYICEELMRRRADIEVVWRTPNKGESGVRLK